MPSVPEIVAMSALISDDHSVIGETVGKIERKADAFRIAFVERENNDGSRLLLRPNDDMAIKSGDRLILFVASDDVPTIERILER